jgi:hypothetical protein
MESVQSPTIAKESLLVTVWALCGASVAFFIARLAIRKRFTARLWLDDWLSGFAVGFLFAESLLITIMANSMYDTLRISSEPSTAVQNPEPLAKRADFPPTVESYMKLQFAQMICFWTCIWLVKASFLTLSYRLLPTHLRPYTILWFTIAGFCALFYVLSVISYPIACSSFSPRKSFSTVLSWCFEADFLLAFCSGNHSVTLSHVSLRFSTALDIITDIFIIALPISLVFRVQLPPRTKVTLVAIFALEGLMILFASLRLAFSDTQESKWPEVTALSLWSVVESGIAVIVVNVIEFKLLFSINHLGNTISSAYPAVEKERTSTLPPTLPTSVMSPPGMASPPPAATFAEPVARQSMPAFRPSGIVVPYTPDPGPVRYSPPRFSDASNPRLRTHFAATSPSTDRTPSRRWSDPISHNGMEEILISRDLDDLHAEIVAREEMLATEPGIYQDAMTMTDDNATRTYQPTEDVIADDATANDLVIQGSLVTQVNEDDESDMGLEGYDLGGLSYYIPETPEAHRTSFYNI